MRKFIENFKGLPVSAKRLLGLGVVLAFAVALPLFIWGILTQRFELRERASIGELGELCTPCGGSTGITCLSSLICQNGVCVTDQDTECSTPAPTTCSPVPMILSLSPATQSGKPGDTKRYQISVTNNDKASCDGSRTVILSAGTPTLKEKPYTGWEVNFLKQNFLLGPKKTFATYVDVKSATADYVPGNYVIPVTVKSLEAPQNESSGSITYRLISTSTPTPTPTPTPIKGVPNFCGGTCGSNYNCQGGFFCYQGFCRNPLCKEDVNCDCITPTPQPTSQKTKSPTTTSVSTPTPTPTTKIVYLSPQPTFTAKPSRSPSLSPTPTAWPQKAKADRSFLLYIAAGSFAGSLLFFAINRFKKH